MFSTFPSNYLGEQKNFFLFARNLINTMDMINISFQLLGGTKEFLFICKKFN